MINRNKQNQNKTQINHKPGWRNIVQDREFYEKVYRQNEAAAEDWADLPSAPWLLDSYSKL